MIFLQPYKKYAVFRGRARRLEFGSFFAFTWAMIFILNFGHITLNIHNFFGENFDTTSLPICASGPNFCIELINSEIHILISYALFFNLITFIPLVALTVRRLHDINRSGFWALVSVIPLIGLIFLLALIVVKGDKEENRFGENPIGVKEEK